MEYEALENVWFAARYSNLPAVAGEQLRLASLAYADSAKAEMHLALARAIAPITQWSRSANIVITFTKAAWKKRWT